MQAPHSGSVVIINAIELAPHIARQAQTDFHEIVDPIGWESQGIPPSECNP
jgi:hypothetical protein